MTFDLDIDTLVHVDANQVAFDAQGHRLKFKIIGKVIEGKYFRNACTLRREATISRPRLETVVRPLVRAFIV